MLKIQSPKGNCVIMGNRSIVTIAEHAIVLGRDQSRSCDCDIAYASSLTMLQSTLQVPTGRIVTLIINRKSQQLQDMLKDTAVMRLSKSLLMWPITPRQSIAKLIYATMTNQEVRIRNENIVDIGKTILEPLYSSTYSSWHFQLYLALIVTRHSRWF